MNHSDPHLPESHDERLEQVLAEYLNAVESGQAIEPADLIARHPDLAADLRSFFRNRLEIDRLAQPLRHPEDTATLLGHPGAGSASAGETVRYFGDYELLSEIARGGMGVVYKARQRNLNRVVALKMILAGHLANESDVKRFYAEAEAAAALDHPGIVPIFEIGQHEGQHYFSMAFIEGENLARRVAEGPLPPREAAELVRKVAEAVDYAHQKGIIHRDLKPGNVLLDQTGQPRVTDFGLAKHLAADSGLTGTGQILGTPSYMPPEQAAGRIDAVSPASDVYSLGAILYCLITGRPPFQAATPLETLQQVLNQEPAPSRQLNAQVPVDLDTIVLKCLEKDPRRRFGTARELCDELTRFLAGDPIRSRPVGPVTRLLKWSRRRPAQAALGIVSGLALMALAGLAVGVGYYGRLRQALDKADQARIEALVAKDEAILAKEQAVWAENESRKQKLMAEDAMHVARQAEKVAVAQREQARDLTQRARRYLYASDINLAWQSWQSGRVDRMRSLLSRQSPAPSETDLRGFEWRFLHSVGHPERLTFPGSFPIVRSMEFVSDGSRLYSSHRVGTNRGPGQVRMWSPATGGESQLIFESVRTFESGYFAAETLDCSDDGKLLAFDNDTEIRVIDTESGAQRFVLKSHQDFLHALSFSPDGTRLASGSLDKTVRLWDTTTGTETGKPLQHRLGVLALAWSPDGTRIVAGTGDSRAPTWSQKQNGELRLWDATNQTEIQTFDGVTSQVNSVAFTPDGAGIVSGGISGEVVLWNSETGAVVRRFGQQQCEIWGVALSPDGAAVAAACGDGAVRVWQLATGEEMATLRGHAGQVSCVRFHPRTGELVSGGYDGTIKIWKSIENRVRTNLGPHSWTIKSIQFSSDSQTIVTADYTSVRVFDAATGKPQRLIHPDHWMVSAAVTNDLATVYVGGFEKPDGGGSGFVSAWNLATGERLFGIDPQAGVAVTVELAPNSRYLVAHGRKSDYSLRPVSLWELSGEGPPTLKGTWTATAEPQFSSDSSQLLLATTEGVRLISTATGTVAREFSQPSATVRELQISPDLQTVAAGCDDGQLIVWNAADGSVRGMVAGHSQTIRRMLFAPDSSALVTASFEETRIWDLAPLALRTELFVPASPMCITPDSQTLMTTSGMVTLWQLSTGQELLRLEGYRILSPTCIAVSPDGTILAEGGGSRDENEGVYIWRAPPVLDDASPETPEK